MKTLEILVVSNPQESANHESSRKLYCKPVSFPERTRERDRHEECSWGQNLKYWPQKIF